MHESVGVMSCRILMLPAEIAEVARRASSKQHCKGQVSEDLGRREYVASPASQPSCSTINASAFLCLPRQRSLILSRHLGMRNLSVGLPVSQCIWRVFLHMPNPQGWEASVLECQKHEDLFFPSILHVYSDPLGLGLLRVGSVKFTDWFLVASKGIYIYIYIYVSLHKVFPCSLLRTR